MTNATSIRPSYAIEGYYFQEGGKTTPDTHFHYSDRDSIIDHQRMWYEVAIKNGYRSGELDSIATIRANYKGELTNEQLLAIVNDGTLMDAPFGELFPEKINACVINLLEAEYRDLKSYVLESEVREDCSEELARMNTIQNEIARLTFHAK